MPAIDSRIFLLFRASTFCVPTTLSMSMYSFFLVPLPLSYHTHCIVFYDLRRLLCCSWQVSAQNNQRHNQGYRISIIYMLFGTLVQLCC
jgi:hypothetical protein